MPLPPVHRFGLFARILCPLVWILSAQVQIGPDEVSLRAAPYWPAGETIRAQVELVEAPVVVRDRAGNAVAGLQRDDFEIFDAGKKQAISAFSVETFPRAGGLVDGTAAVEGKSEKPRRFIGLVLDDLNTDAINLHRAKVAAERYVAEALSPGDLVSIFTTAQKEQVVFTADVEKLRTAIEAVSPHPRYSEESSGCPLIRSYEAYLLANHLDHELLKAKAAELEACSHGSVRDPESVVESIAGMIWENARGNTRNTLRSLAAVVDTIGKMPGQRLMLLASSGFVSGNEEQWLQQITTAALHSGVIVNSLDLRGLTLSSGESRMDALASLAWGTGGQFFANNNDLTAGLRRLGAVPEVLYMLGFASGGVIHDGKYHALKVRLLGGRRGAVQARMGYTAPPKEAPAGQASPGDHERILMGSARPADIAMRVTVEPGADTVPKIAMKAWIDVSRLNFERKQDRRTQKVTVIAALLDGEANFVTGRQAVVDLALKDSSFEQLAAAGVTVALSLHAPPGTYDLRVLVQEASTGKVTLESRPIELHPRKLQ